MFIIQMFILSSLQVFTDGMEQSGRKNTRVGPLQCTSHFSPPDRLITQDMVGANSLQRLTVSIVAGIKTHLPHMPLFLFKPHIGCQKCDTVILSYHCPRYTGSYQTSNWAWLAWVHEQRGLIKTERNSIYHLLTFIETSITWFKYRCQLPDIYSPISVQEK